MMNRLNAVSCPSNLRLSKLSLMAEAWWNRMHLAADDWGIFQANPKILKGKLWPLRDDITPEIIQSLLNEYTETELVHQFTHKDEKYGFFLGWFEHQKIRYMSARIYPAPPESEISFKINHKINSKGEKVERFGSDCVEVIVHCTHKERTKNTQRAPVTVTVTVTETVTEGKEGKREKPALEPIYPQLPVEIMDNSQKPPIYPKQQKPLKSPACHVYRDIFHLWPNLTQEAEINSEVVGEDQVQKWSDICREWALRGYRPTGVDGMLDWFRTGIPERNGKPASQADKISRSLRTVAERIAEHKRAERMEQEQYG